MIRTIAVVGLVAAVTAPQAAFAVSSSGYGTEGPYGRRLHTQAQTPFQRDWNYWNESKYRAEEGSRWLRRHGERFPSPF